MMNTTQLFKTAFLLMILGVIGCNMGEDGPPEPIAFISLTSKDYYSVTDSPHDIELKVEFLNYEGKKIEFGSYDIISNEENLGNTTTFTEKTPGTYKLIARYKDQVSEPIEINIRNRKTYPLKEYQIIFHVVHDGEPLGTGYNLNAEILMHQIEQVNDLFRTDNKINVNSANPNIYFKPAVSDPLGNPIEEPGINRIKRPNQSSTIVYEDWLWDHYWDPDHYINVWVGSTDNGSSYGKYPLTDCEKKFPLLICTPSEIPFRLEGIAFNSNHAYEGSDVLPHEIGHFFGLAHVFKNNCYVDADYCPDTKQYDRDLYESGKTNRGRVSCFDGQKFIGYNIMDYWAQPKGFRDLTYDQAERIRYVVEHGKWRGSKAFTGRNKPKQMSKFKRFAKSNENIIVCKD